MIGFLGIPHWWWHPLTGLGYQWWSGIGSDIGEVTLITAITAGFFGAYKHHQCHVDGCRLPGHLDPEVHAPACPKHHSLGHLHGTSQAKRNS